jgi:hypothetical protein
MRGGLEIDIMILNKIEHLQMIVNEILVCDRAVHCTDTCQIERSN